MAIPLAASAALQTIAASAPAIKERALAAIKAATNGAVTKPADIVSYVGKTPERLSVVASAMAVEGIPPNFITDELAARSSSLSQIRESARQVVAGFVARAQAGSPGIGANDVAADMLRKEQVRVALSIYGNSRNYMLCHPNGGIPQADFDWYNQVVRG